MLEKISLELPNIKFCNIYLEKPEKIDQILQAHQRSNTSVGRARLLTYLMLLYGAYGMTSAASCVIPRENTDMFNFVKSGNLEEAREISLQGLPAERHGFLQCSRLYSRLQTVPVLDGGDRHTRCEKPSAPTGRYNAARIKRSAKVHRQNLGGSWSAILNRSDYEND